VILLAYGDISAHEQYDHVPFRLLGASSTRPGEAVLSVSCRFCCRGLYDKNGGNSGNSGPGWWAALCENNKVGRTISRSMEVSRLVWSGFHARPGRTGCLYIMSLFSERYLALESNFIILPATMKVPRPR